MDPALNMNSHINNIIRSCYIQIRSLAKIRKYLSMEATEKLTHAFISSRLDNLNALLYNLPDYQLKRLQLVMNNAARLVMKLRKSCHITPVLIELHWLPIECRIKYKLLLLVFKCLQNLAPSYLCSLLQPYTPSRALRSSSQHLLIDPVSHKKYGDRAFAVAGPRLWNALPMSVRQCSTVESLRMF